jgi:osmotically-inducible protein OsmY
VLYTTVLSHAAQVDRQAIFRTNTIENNNKSDEEFTIKLRASIVADKLLSTAAHNIRIITVGKMVTLSGAVATREEKLKLEKMARNNDKSKTVFNTLTY